MSAEPEKVLLTQLEETARLLVSAHAPRPGWVYPTSLHFLLEHGAFYPPTPKPAHIPLGAPRCCFANALLIAAWHDLQYVEGQALVPGPTGEPLLAMPHAWVSDASGVAYEVTTPFNWLAYFGMPFSCERADDATWVGDSCVLDDWQRGHPLLFERWTGEKPLPSYSPTLHMQELYKRKQAGGLLGFERERSVLR